MFGDKLFRCNIDDISVINDKIGFKSLPLRINVDKLRINQYIGVIHVDNSHFVALIGQDSQAFHIMETGYEGPPRMERWTDGDLMARWDGVILVISKPENGKLEGVTTTKTTPSHSGDSHGK